MIVTGICDLERYEPRGKSTLTYIEGGRWLLGSNVPLIIFTEPALREPIERLRPSGSTTWWVEVSDPFPHYHQLEEGIRRSRYRWNPLKDTPRYLALMRRKIEWLARGAKLFRGPVTWVDIGLSADSQPAVLLEGHPSRIRLCELSYVPKSVRHDRSLFYADHYWPVAGGLLRGTPEDLRWLNERVEDEWTWCLENAFAATDEMMVGFIRFQHPERFDCYYADHTSLVDNWTRVRKSRELILQMGLRALDDGNSPEAKARFDAVASS